MNDFDVVIVGAGAAGLMCAIEAGKRERRVLLVDHAKTVGEKIRISGGGRCNFTNIHATPANFLSQNPRFCVSALKRYTPKDFIALVEKHGIAYHEKTLGQLFCDGSSKQIINMLVAECHAADVVIRLNTAIVGYEKSESGFALQTSGGDNLTCTSLVISTGGPSIPKMGASGWGYDVARAFGLKIITPRPALVPFTLSEILLEHYKTLSGVATDSIASCGKAAFREAMLFTHRGLSGPSILQISSYWKDGDTVTLNLAPETDLLTLLKAQKTSHPKQEILSSLAQILPRRLAELICNATGVHGRLADLSYAKLQSVADHVNRWQIVPSGTEGFRTAEVTLGGVDTTQLSSQSFETSAIPGLYFIGEVLDVTGHLGGFNFQWAWASGHAAGQFA